MRVCKTLLFSSLVPIVFYSLVANCPIGQALVIGGDDGFELSKSLLLATRPGEAAKMWNDQPWLYAMVTATLFKWCGAYAIIPRLENAILAGVLCVALCFIIAETAGVIEFLLVGIFLLSAEGMPALVLSTMLELPAIAIAALAGAIWVSAERFQWGRIGVCVSGAVFGMALQTKLTSLVFLLPIIGYALLKRGWRAGTKRVLFWTTAVVVVFVSIALVSPTFDFGQLWESHSKSRATLDPIGRQVHSFHAYYLAANPVLLLAAAPGLWISFRRRSPELVFVVLLLASASLFAAFQRPWWGYYLLHIYIPLSMLGAIGAGSVFRNCGRHVRIADRMVASSAPEDSGMAPPVSPRTVGLSAMTMASIVALWCGFALPRWLNELNALRTVQVASESRVLHAAKAYTADTKWLYTTAREHAFYAGLNIPPELIVLSKKRFLATPLTEAGVFDVVRKYAPEMLLLKKDKEVADDKWMSWVKEHYILVEQEEDKELWVSIKLTNVGLEKSDPRIASWDL